MSDAGQPACGLQGAEGVAEGLLADQCGAQGGAAVAQEGEDAFGQRRRPGQATEDLQVSAVRAEVCGVLGCSQMQWDGRRGGAERCSTVSNRPSFRGNAPNRGWSRPRSRSRLSRATPGLAVGCRSWARGARRAGGARQFTQLRQDSGDLADCRSRQRACRRTNGSMISNVGRWAATVRRR